MTTNPTLKISDLVDVAVFGLVDVEVEKITSKESDNGTTQSNSRKVEEWCVIERESKRQEIKD